jgi:Mce-associated membrane protein
VPRRKLPAGATIADDRRMGALSTSPSNSAPEVADAAEIAEADARAAAARARAERLREQLEAASGDPDDAAHTEETASAPSRRRWLRPRRPSRKALAAVAAVLVICASLAGSGYLVWHHRGVVQQRQRSAEFAAAARNAVVTMMTIDSTKAREDLQRFVDDTTGMFKISILMGGEDAVKAVEESKVNSKGTVQAVAVESMTKDSAIVLLAAKSEITKPGQPKPESRSMRLVVTVERDGGQLKVSRVEFVP